jgi:hypothetical protein
MNDDSRCCVVKKCENRIHSNVVSPVSLFFLLFFTHFLVVL